MIQVATSGYSYPDWVGPFYPEKTPRAKMLEYYSQIFSFTEINSTYYHMPSCRNYLRLPARTPPGFRFSVKAHGSMTHERTATSQTCRDFLAALEPLREAGRLLCIVAQFPYSFHRTNANRDYLLYLAEWLGEVRLAVEFRNSRWTCCAVFNWLRENGLCYVAVDAPRLPGLAGQAAVATGGIGYVRFHGRNNDKWWEHGQAYERYNYLYTEEELKGWINPLYELEKAAGEVFVCFNNHFIGQAVVNARMLTKMLTEKS